MALFAIPCAAASALKRASQLSKLPEVRQSAAEAVVAVVSEARRAKPTGANLRRSSAANSSPPPCGEGLGVGVGVLDTALPPPPDPPPQPSPSRNRVYAGFGHSIKRSKSATADFDWGEGVVGEGSARGLVTLDMGGTSADIAFIEGGTPLEVTEGVIARRQVDVPSLDLTTISAGGGSIAAVDS